MPTTRPSTRSPRLPRWRTPWTSRRGDGLTSPRSKLLLRLLRTGSAALEQEHSEVARSRLEAINASSGKCADAFDDDHLAELRQDWPE